MTLKGTTSLVLLLFLASYSYAKNYYFHADSGLNTNLGTMDSPWKTLAKYRTVALQPGDSILLKRGSTWTLDSISISTAGTSTSPIVLGAYGSSSLPSPHILGNMGNVVTLRNSNHVIIQDLKVSNAKWGCINLADSTNTHILIQRVETEFCGGAIYLSGTNITVRNSLFHHGHMVVNTTTDVNDNDDYGASGIGFSRLNGCEVYGNRLWELRAPSYDYGEDGGALEFWKTVRNCDIWGNFSYRNNGFSEFGGQAGDTVENVSIHHNISIDSKIMACPHLFNVTNTYGIGYNNLHIDHNLIVNRFNKRYEYFMATTGDDLSESWRIKIRNNIFVSDSLTYFSWQSSGRNPSFEHSGNLLWSPSHNFWVNGVTPGPGDQYFDPLFNGTSWDINAPLDTSVSRYFLTQSSPAVAAVPSLGYVRDFFGNPVSATGQVDIGPIAMGSTTPILPLNRPAHRLFHPVRTFQSDLLGRQVQKWSVDP